MSHLAQGRKLPKGIRNLRFLQTLSKVVLSSMGDDGSTFNLGDLMDLKQLRGSLTIEGLGFLDVADAKKLELKEKQHLVSLKVFFYPTSLSSQEVAEALALPPDLKKLRLFDYGGAQLPDKWIVSLNKMRVLELCCPNFTVLPPLGNLQHLEELSIGSMPGVKRIGEEFLGIEAYSNNGAIDIFPKLKSLVFTDMQSWEEWDITCTVIAKGVEDGNLRIMPCLQKLELLSCIKLKEVPEILIRTTQIRKPLIRRCPFLEQKYERNS